MEAAKSPRILVVDDNPATLYSTSRILRSAGWQTIEAANGLSAVEVAKHGIDLAVLDVNLPDINGFEVCRQIRTLPDADRIPIIHLSATFVGDRDKVQGLEVGADGYLTHPIEPPVLIATVRAFLRTREVERDRARLLVSERAAREEAERANRVKDEFLAVLSHELRPPLHAITGWAEILKIAGSDPGTVKEAADAIDRNSASLAKMIADLLDISRITNGQIRLDLKPVDFVATLHSAIAALQQSASNKQITIQTEIESTVPSLLGDPDRLQQVIWNLVSNAIKFTPRNGAITIRLVKKSDELEIAVADTGLGISKELLGVVFDRFRQGDSTVTRSHGGLGLGLALAKQFVELHGGRIHAESAGPGTGATFYVHLPIPGDSTLLAGNPVPTMGSTSHEVSLKGFRLLIVDDDADARQLMRRILEPLGASIQLAGSAAQALEDIEAFKPHALISDIGMPQTDGYKLIREVRDRGYSSAQLPAIALTAFATLQDKQNALAADFQYHLTKPTQAEDLISAVQALRASLSPN